MSDEEHAATVDLERLGEGVEPPLDVETQLGRTLAGGDDTLRSPRYDDPVRADI